MDACILVVRHWLHRKLLLFPNMSALDCSLLVVSGSGQVCVHGDYLPSSPPGRGSWRKETDRATMRDFHSLLSAVSELLTPERQQKSQDDKEKSRSLSSLWRNLRSGWSITCLLSVLISLLTFSISVSLSVSSSPSPSDTFLCLFPPQRLLVTQTPLRGSAGQVKHQWMEPKIYSFAG